MNGTLNAVQKGTRINGMGKIIFSPRVLVIWITYFFVARRGSYTGQFCFRGSHSKGCGVRENAEDKFPVFRARK